MTDSATIAAEGGRTMIELIDVTKRFAGQRDPAVGHLDLSVPEGEIVMLIGPSGCGKTTTLKMINRLIEPSVRPDHHRRRGRDRRRRRPPPPHHRLRHPAGRPVPAPDHRGEHRHGPAAARLEEGADHARGSTSCSPSSASSPTQFRDRYPKELSGGQQQRVGVARGLAADPAVMLMDEPFGAIDPVTRDRLQDEFLALQEQVKKTICFVTHDLTEAVKLGDRIAVFGHGGKLHQYDVPAKVLSEPADDFVTEFVGGGAAVRRLALVTLDDLPLRDVLKAGKDRTSRGDLVAEVDGGGRPRRWHHVPGHAEGEVADGHDPSDASLHAAVDQMLTDHVPVVAVVDEAGRLVRRAALGGPGLREHRRGDHRGRQRASDREADASPGRSRGVPADARRRRSGPQSQAELDELALIAAEAEQQRHERAAAEDARAARRRRVRSVLELVVSPVVADRGGRRGLDRLMSGDLDTIEQRALNPDQVLLRLQQHLVLSRPVGALHRAHRGSARRACSPDRCSPGYRSGLLTFLSFAQALPPLGVMFLLPALMGFGLRTAVLAIVIAAVLPVLRNVLVGL